jgi:hypothetical protein
VRRRLVRTLLLSDRKTSDSHPSAIPCSSDVSCGCCTLEDASESKRVRQPNWQRHHHNKLCVCVWGGVLTVKGTPPMLLNMVLQAPYLRNFYRAIAVVRAHMYSCFHYQK